jgi:putative oxidoreductase
MLFGKLSKFHAGFHVVFRVLVGLLFAQHGAQKLFGWFTENAAANLFSLMGLAGTIEFFGGLFIALGFLTRLWSLLGGITMLFAYFMVHFGNGWIPIVNRGELALVYFACFIALFGYGGGKLQLDNLFFKKELF